MNGKSYRLRKDLNVGVSNVRHCLECPFVIKIEIFEYVCTKLKKGFSIKRNPCTKRFPDCPMLKKEVIFTWE
jgi:hypothetical protein